MKLIIDIPAEEYNEIKNCEVMFSGIRSGKTFMLKMLSRILDGEPLKQGYWIDEVTIIGAKICRCSECNFIIQKPLSKDKFCRNCGAKMTESEETEC